MISKATVKYIQSLQQKKFRDVEGCFVAEGPKCVLELLQGNVFHCRAIYALDSWIQQLDAALLSALQNRIEPVQEFELQKISGLSTANKVLAVFEKRKLQLPKNLAGQITLVLDDIQDPGNLGTIIRIADWFGVAHIICSAHTADMYNSKVVQSTMASLQRVQLHYTDISAWLQSQKEIKKYAAALNGQALQNYQQLTEGILIIGNESQGIKDEVMQLADEKITIPRIGTAESLNAAVATGILLYGLLKG